MENVGITALIRTQDLGYMIEFYLDVTNPLILILLIGVRYLRRVMMGAIKMVVLEHFMTGKIHVVVEGSERHKDLLDEVMVTPDGTMCVYKEREE